jgi:hypothetical protein
MFKYEWEHEGQVYRLLECEVEGESELYFEMGIGSNLWSVSKPLGLEFKHLVEENARFEAQESAAPDLHEALTKAVAELRNYLADARGFDDRNDLTNLINDCGAAVAKAEGK